MSKECPSCKDPNASFNTSKTTKDGLRYSCKSCEKINSANWRKTNKEKCRAYDKNRKERKREQNYRRKYGISIDTYESMLKEQGGCCMICRRAELKDKKLDIDHCHRTGKIRGLLCARCNKTIGLLEDDGQLALNMIAYLDKFKEQNG